MRKNHHKYFWDGEDNLSGKFKLQRIIEYAAFPDLIKYPLDEFKKHLPEINLDKLRTSEKRKRFIRLIAPLLNQAENWDDVFEMILTNPKAAYPDKQETEM